MTVISSNSAKIAVGGHFLTENCPGSRNGWEIRKVPPNQKEPNKVQPGSGNFGGCRQISKNRITPGSARQILGNCRQIRHWILAFHPLIKAESRFAWTRKKPKLG